MSNSVDNADPKMIRRIQRRVRKLPSYAPHVKVHFDADRPKYTEAIKTLAALAPDERAFRVVVARLNEACAEAEDFAR